MAGWFARMRPASSAESATSAPAADAPPPAVADHRPTGDDALQASPEALLRRLEWTVLRRLDSVLQGDWRSFLRGGGVDLADLREYQPEDDVRHIDWNVTARLQAPHVRLYLEDRDLTAWLLLDLSGSLDVGSTGRSKRALSAGLAGTLARVITRHGNRVGALLYRRQLDGVLPPGCSRRHVLTLLQRMQAPAAPGPRGETDLAELLRAAEGVVRRRSLLIVVSDFISRPGWAPVLARLARRHDVIAVRLLDPAEAELPDLGGVTLEDAETGEQLFFDAADPALRRRYQAIAAEREAELRAALAASGTDVLEVATDDDLLEVMMRFADLRRQRARLGGLSRMPAGLRRAAPASGMAP